MRWKSKAPPKHGDVRTKEKFLLFPWCLKGEWRWLETSKIKQRFFVGKRCVGYWYNEDWA